MPRTRASSPKAGFTSPDAHAAEAAPTTPDDLLVVERAAEPGLTCATSGEPIAPGELCVRVRASPARVTHHKVGAFARRSLRVERITSPSSACRLSGAKLAKGDPCFSLALGGARKGSHALVSADAGAGLVRLVLCAADARPSELAGMSALVPAERKRILAAASPAAGTRAELASALDAALTDCDAPQGEGGARRTRSRAGESAGPVEPSPEPTSTTVVDLTAAEATPRASAAAARKRARSPAAALDSAADKTRATRRAPAERGAARPTRAAGSAEEAEPRAEHTATPGANHAAEAEQPADGLSAYERERLANIARNREMLARMGLLDAAAELKAGARPAAASAEAAAARARGIATARKPKAQPPAEPGRRSMRQQGRKPDGQFAAGVLSEGADGSLVVLVDGEAVRYSAGAAAAADTAASAAADAERAARRRRDLPFESRNGGPRSDAHFLRTLGSAGALGAREPAQPVSALGAARLSPACVAKLTPRDIVHLAFQPRADALLVAAADKTGAVAFWDVARAEAAAAAEEGEEEGEEGGGAAPAAAAAPACAESEDEGAEDGVLLLQPHAQYVSGLRWGGHAHTRLYSCSYEGTVRCLDVAHCAGSPAALELLHRTEEHELSALELDAAGRTCFVADNHGAVIVLDVRAGPRAQQHATVPGAAADAPQRSDARAALALHERKVNMLSLEPGAERALASCSTDSTVCVWDVRALGRGCKPAHTLGHSKSCQAAAFAPDGSGRLLTTCYDNALRVWSAEAAALGDGSAHSSAKAKPPPPPRPTALTIRHNTNTGRWIVPFRAIWAPASDGIIVGAMTRQMHLLSAATGKLEAALESEYMTAIPARNAAHPTLRALAGGTASGRVHIYK